MTTLLTLAMSIYIQDYLINGDIAGLYIDNDSLSIIAASGILFKPAENPLFIQQLQKGNTLQRPLTPLPINESGMLPTEIYGALIGLICSTGCTFAPNKNAYMYPDEFRFIFAATDLDFLLWVQAYFAPGIYSTAGGNVPMPYTNDRGTTTVGRFASSSSLLLVNILYEHGHQVGNHFLPDHFEQFFGGTTLAFGAMRNGRRMGNRLQITAPKLNQLEKDRLVQVLSIKLKLTAKGANDGRTLEIYNLADGVSNISVHFHETQQHRLQTRQRKS